MTTVIDLNAININGCSVSFRIAGYESEDVNDTYQHLYKSAMAFKALTDPIRKAKDAAALAEWEAAGKTHTLTVSTIVAKELPGPGDKIEIPTGPVAMTPREAKEAIEKEIAKVEEKIAEAAPASPAQPAKRGPGRPRKNPEVTKPATDEGAKASEPAKVEEPAPTKPADLATTVLEAVEPTEFDDEEEAEELDQALASDEDEEELSAEEAPAKPVITAEDFKGLKLRRDIVRMCQSKGLTKLEDIVEACKAVQKDVPGIKPFTDMMGAIKPAFDAVQMEDAKK